MQGNPFGDFAKINGRVISGSAMRFFFVVDEATKKIIGGYAAHTEKDALKCASALIDNLEEHGFDGRGVKPKVVEVGPEEFVQAGMTWQGDPCGRSNRQPAAR